MEVILSGGVIYRRLGSWSALLPTKLFAYADYAIMGSGGSPKRITSTTAIDIQKEMLRKTRKSFLPDHTKLGDARFRFMILEINSIITDTKAPLPYWTPRQGY